MSENRIKKKTPPEAERNIQDFAVWGLVDTIAIDHEIDVTESARPPGISSHDMVVRGICGNGHPEHGDDSAEER